MNAIEKVHRTINILPTALGAAAVLHLAVIFGVGFDAAREQYIPPSLEVVLVKNPTETPPDTASHLAQHAQQGGGESLEHKRPSAPRSGNTPAPKKGSATKAVRASSPKQTQTRETAVITQIFSDQKIQQKDQQEQISKTQQARASEKLRREQEIAQLTAEIARAVERQASRPRTMYVTASTKKATAANYMLKWVRKVERIGNLNLPAQSIARTGSLVLVVGINQQGRLTKVTVQRSSGDPQLDTAATEIVKMASPFAPMPAQLAKETDVLYITRTWQFNADKSLTTR